MLFRKFCVFLVSGSIFVVFLWNEKQLPALSYTLIMEQLKTKLDSIAELLSAYAAKNGLTQRELASKLDKEVSYVNKVLQGEANLTLRTITEFEDKLGLQLLRPPKWQELSAISGADQGRSEDRLLFFV